MQIYTSIISFFQEGGAFMYPIVAILALGLAIAVERYLFLSRTSVSNRMLWNRITPHLKAGKFDEAAAETSKSKSAIGSILNYGLQRVRASQRRDDIEQALRDQTARVLRRDAAADIANHEVTIMGDRELPYSLLMRVMATCAAAD